MFVEVCFESERSEYRHEEPPHWSYEKVDAVVVLKLLCFWVLPQYIQQSDQQFAAFEKTHDYELNHVVDVNRKLVL